MGLRRRYVRALLATAVLALSACTSDATPAASRGIKSPPSSTRPLFVTCADGSVSTAIADYEPSRDPSDTLEKVLAEYLESQRERHPDLAPWYADANFAEVNPGASEDDPDGLRANPDRRRSFLGARPDGTGFHRADFEKAYADGGWNIVGSQTCNGESSQPRL